MLLYEARDSTPLTCGAIARYFVLLRTSAYSVAVSFFSFFLSNFSLTSALGL